MPHIERLKQLADHLLHGQLIHREFDFMYYNRDVESSDNPCGTAGCAIGECPAVWPDKWHFCSVSFRPILIGSINNSSRKSSMSFFDLSDEEHMGLFVPDFQQYCDLPILHANATKEQVANNILEYCKRFEQ